MTRSLPETIAAIATPPGTGGVGIVRISGSRVPELARAILGQLPSPRQATYTHFRDRDGVPIDQGLAIYFQEPDSFTGEHVLELQGHGGPVVLDMLLARAVEAGGRIARPGEFSERAFLNGKLDLAQAEAIADLIGAASAAAARAALNSLQGTFSARVRAISEQLIALRVFLEAHLDFPDEELDLADEHPVLTGLNRIQEGLTVLKAESRQGQMLRDGMRIVLAGRPNAGKSSLLNLLSRRDAAIVSHMPGTTRDVLHTQIQIDGMPLHIIDTAGLRATSDEIEAEGVRRAQAAMQSADRVLLIIDDDNEEEGGIRALLQELPAGVPVTLVRNKVDVSGRSAGFVENGALGIAEVAMSAREGRGLDLLHEHLKRCMGFLPAGEGTFSARRRHLDALARCEAFLETVAPELQAHRNELAAEGLRLAHGALAEITGEFTSDDLLGRVFSTFCIGK